MHFPCLRLPLPPLRLPLLLHQPPLLRLLPLLLRLLPLALHLRSCAPSVFSALDVNGDGRLSVGELTRCCQQMVPGEGVCVLCGVGVCVNGVWGSSQPPPSPLPHPSLTPPRRHHTA